MSLTQITFKNEEELKEHIQTHRPTLYHSSQTSTVIPYDKLAAIYQKQDITLGNLSNIPGTMEINAKGNLVVRGAISWQAAREFLKDKNLSIMTAPTEELALILAGVATSCTGERCFHFGNLRSQVESIKYFNFGAKEITLKASQELTIDAHLAAYQKEFKSYQNFKNAPYPRLKVETDLMVGFEGQLGVISEVELKVAPAQKIKHLFMLIPKWEDDLSLHLKINADIQNFRKEVILCEFVDANSFSYLPAEERANKNMDVLFFEIKEKAFDKFYDTFLSQYNEEHIFEISENKFHHLRSSVPRAIFEKNHQMGVTKMGTDIQVEDGDYNKLMHLYQQLSGKGVEYNLFGHFGDCHLHFNFMPSPQQVETCHSYLAELYHKITEIKASPFAEHGIGLIKQKYIKSFWSSTQPQTFRILKDLHDPHRQFFPGGFMELE